MTTDERLVRAVPSERQLRHQQLEFYAFIHFTVNTFTDREWGDGTEDPAIFDPKRLDAEQWVRAIRSAGMRGLILTCKHHDGFCLWPSKATLHSVKSAPFRNGGGDVVREVSDACKKYGLAFGVYLSPWDRNCPLYGSGKPYDDYFVCQLTELLTGYGEIFSVWFDGACGEGPNGKKQYYDWPRYYETVRKLQPNACISVCGPDVRWCGNEAGVTRESEWSVVPERMRDTEKVAEHSQKTEDGAHKLRRLRAQDRDLGSRALLADEERLIWYPAEVDTSIRPGWFWHENENGRVRSPETLFDIYVKSVGGNATLLLNVPPTNEGLIHENDARVLAELGAMIENAFRVNLAPQAALTADGAALGHPPEDALTDGLDTFYMPEGAPCSLTLRFDRPHTIGFIKLKENVRMSQRIERFTVEAETDGAFRTVYTGTTVGYQRIVPLNGITTSALRVSVTDARTVPTLSFLGVYEAN